MTPVLPVSLADGLHLDPAAARGIGEGLSGDYCFAEPFPHIVLDNFLPAALARRAQTSFPNKALPSDRVFDMGYAGLHKRQILPVECDGPARELFDFLNSRSILEFLEGLSTIQGLLPDPYFEGGGFHETTRGGKLGIHADFRINPRLHVHRRLNMIIYLNDDWRAEYRGYLELWDRGMTACARSVAPEFNRCVIFNTDADSFHGHPDPLECPDGITRRSIALYYYTSSRSIYHEVPQDGTLYKARAVDDQDAHRLARSLHLNDLARSWTPPVLLRYVMALKRRMMP